jgi:hypothetical protein
MTDDKLQRIFGVERVGVSDFAPSSETPGASPFTKASSFAKASKDNSEDTVSDKSDKSAWRRRGVWVPLGTE